MNPLMFHLLQNGSEAKHFLPQGLTALLVHSPSLAESGPRCTP